MNKTEFKKQKQQENLNNKLVDACESGDLEEVKELLSKGADINSEYSDSTYSDGITLLSYTAMNGHLEIIKYLIEKGANLYADNNYIVISAAINGHLDIVKFLMNENINIHTHDDMAIKNASLNGHLDVVKELLTQDFNILAKNASLLKAAYGNNLEIIKLLIEHGADVHFEQDSILLISSGRGNFDIVKYLVTEHNCDPAAAAKEAKSALECIDIYGNSIDTHNIIDWCEQYLNSKNLNNKLDKTLDKKAETNINRKKI